MDLENSENGAHPVLQESVFLSLSLPQQPLHLLDLGHIGGAGAAHNKRKTSVSFCTVPANFSPYISTRHTTRKTQGNDPPSKKINVLKINPLF